MALRNGLLDEEDEDEGGGALKSIPSSSSAYDLPALLCSDWLATREKEGLHEVTSNTAYNIVTEITIIIVIITTTDTQEVYLSVQRGR